MNNLGKNKSMDKDEKTILPIRSQADIVMAAAKAEALARGIGLSKVQTAEVAIVVSELASNLVKHRVMRGEIIIRALSREGSKGLEVISSDLGPGMADIEQAMADTYSTAGSLGIGLPAVNRLMDEFELKSNMPGGTLVITRKWANPEALYKPVAELELSVFSRPLPGQSYNGDAYFIKRYEDKVILAVIDGLGHGKYAYEASQAAIDCLENCYRRPINEIFQLCHKRLKGTRGAAMSLGLVNLSNRVMTYAGLGNVLTAVYSSEVSPSPFNFNGTLGLAMQTIKVDDYPLPENCLIMMYSDGILRRFSPADLPDILNQKPQSVARQIIEQYSRDYDDATIIVARLSS